MFCPTNNLAIKTQNKKKQVTFSKLGKATFCPRHNYNKYILRLSISPDIVIRFHLHQLSRNACFFFIVSLLFKLIINF